jgi:putative chitinase
MRAVDVVRSLCPNAKKSYVAAFEQGDALFQKYDVTTPRRMAHFLAQVFHETGGLSIEWESGNYSAERLLQIFGVGHHSAAVTPEEAQKLAHNGPAIFERVYGLGNPKKAAELGNTQPGDGWKYRGGGLMQTTGRGNYRRMGQKCGVDFEGHPEWVLSSQHALKPALAEWGEGNLNAAADRDDIVAITRKINGGLNGLDDRKAWLAKIKRILLSLDLVPKADLPVEAPKTPEVVKQAGGAAAGGAAAGTAAQQAGLPIWAAIAIGICVMVSIGVFIYLRRKKEGVTNVASDQGKSL